LPASLCPFGWFARFAMSVWLVCPLRYVRLAGLPASL